MIETLECLKGTSRSATFSGQSSRELSIPGVSLLPVNDIRPLTQRCTLAVHPECTTLRTMHVRFIMFLLKHFPEDNYRCHPLAKMAELLSPVIEHNVCAKDNANF